MTFMDGSMTSKPPLLLRCHLVLAAAVLTLGIACGEGARAPVSDSILARATGVRTQSGASPDSLAVDATLRLIDSLGARPATRTARRISWHRRADGVLIVATDSVVNLGEDSDVEVGQYANGVVGVATIAPTHPGESLVRYYFDNGGHTVAVTKTFTRPRSVCAGSVSVTVTWVLNGGRA